MIGSYSVDVTQNGTTNLVWSIRANVMDWATAPGTPIPNGQMTSARFRIRYYTGKDITSFNVNLPGSSVSIRSSSHFSGTVVIYVPPDTTAEQIAALAPTYTLDAGATCNQPNGAIPDPPLSTSTPVSYVVTPQDTKDLPAKLYSVIVTRDAPPTN